MKKRNWIQNIDETVSKQIICILNFFGVATPEQWEQGWTQRQLAFKKAMNVESNIGSTSVWLRKGEKIICKVFNKESLVASLDKIRELTKEKNPQSFLPKLQNICADCGVAVVFIKPFSKVPVYGASCWLNSEKPLIKLSLRGKNADSMWFTVFHELGHT